MAVFVAGHRGMVGSAISRLLGDQCVTVEHQTRAELDLTDQSKTFQYLADTRPEAVILAAANVGGILANNTYPADFIYNNLAIQNNVIEGAHRAGVERLLFLGSSCIYPREVPQPMAEEALLTGKLELTNEPYAIAKIAGIKMCESYARQHGRDYRSVMPTNLYGPGDNFHPQNSHVLPALIKRFYEAKLNGLPSVTIWGTGTPRREFLHVEDMAKASLFVLNLDSDTYSANTREQLSHINVGSGVDISILELAQLVAKIVGYVGDIFMDPTKPDGTMRKLMDISRLTSMGWSAQIPLSEGIASTYQWFLSSQSLREA